MKAIRIHQFGDPSVMKLEEIADPAPGPGQVLVGVRAIGVNPVDTYIRAGRYGDRPFPYTPGMDAAGIVEAVGQGVKKVQVGDRVYTAGTLSGAYAQKTLVAETTVFRLPEDITFPQGAALGIPYGTAYRALFIRGKARPGETVLVHGASGGVGLAAVQFARAAGLTVLGTAGSTEGRTLVIKEGAHQVFDHTAADYADAIKALTDGRGVDLILEMLANVNLDKDLNLLAMHGRVVVIGNRGRIEIDPRMTMARESSILGVTLGNATTDELAAIHAAIRAGLEVGALRPMIDTELPLSEAAEAHEEVMKGGSRGKIVLVA